MVLAAGDELVVQGRPDLLRELRNRRHLRLDEEMSTVERLASDEIGLAETRLAPGSDLVGDTLLGLRFRQRHGAIVLGGGGESVWVETEAGLGVHGSRGNGRLEQQDPFLYSAFLRARRGPVAARLGIIGHAFWTNDWSARGNENMGEMRAGVRVGGRTFLDAAAVRGITRTSPAWGLRLRVGRRFGR